MRHFFALLCFSSMFLGASSIKAEDLPGGVVQPVTAPATLPGQPATAPAVITKPVSAKPAEAAPGASGTVTVQVLDQSVKFDAKEGDQAKKALEHPMVKKALEQVRQSLTERLIQELRKFFYWWYIPFILVLGLLVKCLKLWIPRFDRLVTRGRMAAVIPLGLIIASIPWAMTGSVPYLQPLVIHYMVALLLVSVTAFGYDTRVIQTVLKILKRRFGGGNGKPPVAGTA